MRHKIERRKRSKIDFWIKTLRWVGLSGWFIIFITLFMVGAAKPRDENFFDGYLKAQVVFSTWDQQTLEYCFYMMVAGFCLGSAGLYINIIRHRRKTDEYRISLILLALISFLGIIKYLFFL